LQLREVQTQLQDMQFYNKLEELRSKYGGEEVTKEVETEINRRIATTGLNDPTMHFMAIKGEALISKAKQEGAKETAEQIARNTQAYNLNQGTNAPPSKPTDMGSLPDDQWSEALDAELEKLHGDGAV
jgi:hypothetical protein